MDNFQAHNANTVTLHFMGKGFNYSVTIMEGNAGVLIFINIFLDTPTNIHKSEKISFGRHSLSVMLGCCIFRNALWASMKFEFGRL
jgi:hypothetical protein